MILQAGNPGKQQGYSLVIVLVAVVIMGILSEAAISMDSYRVKKSREAELLFRGMAYQKAIQSYVNASVTQRPQYPKRLEDLVLDPRFAYRRHIRQLYLDPMALNTNKHKTDVNEEWRVFRNAEGGITGVASKSKGKPLKKAFFPVFLDHFTKAKTYSDWVFDVNSIKQ